MYCIHRYFVCVGSEDSGESAHMRRLTWAFNARWCNKQKNFIAWSILPLLCGVQSCMYIRSVHRMHENARVDPYKPSSWPSRAWKKFCWHFWVHFGIHAQSVSWCVLSRIGVDAKSGNAPKVPELGQRSTECKLLYIRQILAFSSISYPKLWLKVMQNLLWIIQPCYISKQQHQGMMCVWIKGHFSAKSVKIVAIFCVNRGKTQILSSLLP